MIYNVYLIQQYHLWFTDDHCLYLNFCDILTLFQDILELSLTLHNSLLSYLIYWINALFLLTAMHLLALITEMMIQWFKLNNKRQKPDHFTPHYALCIQLYGIMHLPCVKTLKQILLNIRNRMTKMKI